MTCCQLNMGTQKGLQSDGWVWPLPYHVILRKRSGSPCLSCRTVILQDCSGSTSVPWKLLEMPISRPTTDLLSQKFSGWLRNIFSRAHQEFLMKSPVCEPPPQDWLKSCRIVPLPRLNLIGEWEIFPPPKEISRIGRPRVSQEEVWGALSSSLAPPLPIHYEFRNLGHRHQQSESRKCQKWIWSTIEPSVYWETSCYWNIPLQVNKQHQ